jgi:Tol biopolymer transport system component
LSMAGPLKAQLRHISPDGSMLLAYGSMDGEPENHLWVVPTAGEGPRRLGNLDAHDGAWSPDGRQFIYASDRELFVAQSDGSNPRKLAHLPGKAFWIRWSPDAKLLRFTLVDSETGEQTLWECRATGTSLRRLPLSWDTKPQECCGDWTPNGRYFSFRTFHNSRADIWLIREGLFSGRVYKPTRLTTGPLDYPSAIPSHNGKQLFATGVQPRFEILKYDLRRRLFAPLLPGLSVSAANTSPDGQWLAYVEAIAKKTTLWRSRADGSERLQLTVPPMLLQECRWSPNGKQIAFVGKMPDTPWNIYIVSASGGNPLRLLEDNRNHIDPQWAPDGQSLMFGHPPDSRVEAAKTEAIHTLNLNTNQITTLPGSGGLFAPRWSPDARYVAALTLNQQRLMLFDFSNREWTELVRDVIVVNPRWSRTGAYIYFSDDTKKSVMRVEISSRKVEKILDQGTIDPNALECRFLDTAAKDSILIGCELAASDIYALDVDLP